MMRAGLDRPGRWRQANFEKDCELARWRLPAARGARSAERQAVRRGRTGEHRRALTSSRPPRYFPSMHHASASLLVALVLWPRAGIPADEPAAKGPQITTTIQGDVPDLMGRWLMVANVSMQAQAEQPQNPPTAPIVYRWEVTKRDGKPQLAFRWGGMPPTLKASLDAATQRHERWEPTPEQ